MQQLPSSFTQIVPNPRARLLQGWGRWAAALLLLASADAHAACRSAALDLTTRDMSLELGEYGTLFRDASIPECQPVVHDQLLRKLRLALMDAPRRDTVLERDVRSFERWLAGANVGLAIPTAMQLGGAGLLDSALDQAVRSTIAAYQFNIDPGCGANLVNQCMDDYTQAAVAYAWSAAYERQSDRATSASAYASKAHNVIHDALAIEHHTCIAPADSMPQPCSDAHDAVISFNHGFEDVAYGIGLMTSLSSAVIALEQARAPYVATDDEVSMAWALFREGQKSTLTDGSAFRSDCYRAVNGVIASDSPCADVDYRPRMFPVRTFYQRAFRNAPNEDPYRFDELDESLFQTAFVNDGRYAVYAELGERWWTLRPRLDGYHGVPSRSRTVRH